MAMAISGVRMMDFFGPFGWNGDGMGYLFLDKPDVFSFCTSRLGDASLF